MAVTLTYGHGFLDDTFAVANWNFVNVGFSSASQASNGDALTITATANDAGDEFAYTVRDISSLALSTNTYQKIKIRWATSAASGEVGFYVRVSYTAGSGGGSSDFCLSGDNPGFSQAWMVTTGTLTANRVIEFVTIFADDYPNSYATGPTAVTCDYILIYKGDFTLPNVSNGMNITPIPRYVQLQPISKLGSTRQNLGGDDMLITCSCDLDIGNWKRSGDYIDAEVFYDIVHNAYRESWQWIDTGYEQMKVTLEPPTIRRHGKEHALDLTFKEYRENSASAEASYVQRYGLSL